MVKLEFEFAPPTPQDDADFQMFMKSKTIVQLTLTASDGDTFNITMKQSQVDVRVGQGPEVILGKKLQ